MIKVLFIGGTGIISSACVKLAADRGFEVTLLNRGKSTRDVPEGVKIRQGDFRHPERVREVLHSESFDVVANFVAYTPQDIETSLNLFRGRVGQFIFISSASAYQTPPATLPVRESTLLDNPFWQYSRDKAACEDRLIRAYRDEKFPITIIRPSHTYDQTYFPIEGGWTTVDRMLNGKKVIVHGDGTSLWTLTHHRDFAKGFVGLLGNAHAIGEVFHITSDEWLTWNQIYQIIAEAVGTKADIVHVPSDLINAYAPDWGAGLLGDKAHSFILDNQKIKSLVPDFRCEIPFSVGVREIVTWHLQDVDRRQVNQDFNNLVEKILEAYSKAWPEGKL